MWGKIRRYWGGEPIINALFALMFLFGIFLLSFSENRETGSFGVLLAALSALALSFTADIE
ncbi:hypothetical protein FJY94_04010 [Candidatus Kaiserbacteria bacterium]|nr:hypothetical protein [Candidatus Kaiserbacteria bacterium]